MELAYRLVTEDSALIRKIRDNVIVGINPASDPDGRDRYTDWYYRNKIDDTDDLTRSPARPTGASTSFTTTTGTSITPATARGIC